MHYSPVYTYAGGKKVESSVKPMAETGAKKVLPPVSVSSIVKEAGWLAPGSGGALSEGIRESCLHCT